MSVHIVFSAECNRAFEWQAAGLFYSHTHVRQPGPITRLLACSDEQLANYSGLGIGPTFVHHNMRDGHPLINETGYPSYNKPASVMFWLAQNNVTEEYVALLDTDMLLRTPLDPIALGARRGVVVSAEYTYLIGTRGRFAARFLEPSERALAAPCGGFHIFHREDLRTIAPLWIRFTAEVRAFAHAEPETYLAESFLNWADASGLPDNDIATKRRQAMWQAEMYGYAFAAARAGVSHVIRRDTMLYPGYDPQGGLLPVILHYGSDYTLRSDDEPPRDVYFNKMSHVNLDIHACADSKASHAGPGARGFGGYFFFGPPTPTTYANGTSRSRRDLLCIEHLQLLNAALCSFYVAHCDPPHPRCPEPRATAVDALRSRACADDHPKCNEFAARGECAANPGWMLESCAASCGACDGREAAEIAAIVGVAERIGPLAQLGTDVGGLLRRAEARARARRAIAGLARRAKCAEPCAVLGMQVRMRAPMWPPAPVGLAAPAAFGVQPRCVELAAPFRRVLGAGCDSGEPPPLHGAIAIVPRGGCSFVRKAVVAQAAGASALIIIDAPGAAPAKWLADDGDGAQVRIPVAMIAHADAAPLFAHDPDADGSVALELSIEGFEAVVDASGVATVTHPGAAAASEGVASDVRAVQWDGAVGADSRALVVLDAQSLGEDTWDAWRGEMAAACASRGGGARVGAAGEDDDPAVSSRRGEQRAEKDEGGACADNER